VCGRGNEPDLVMKIVSSISAEASQAVEQQRLQPDERSLSLSF
jgi:hypothetical protein